MPMLIQSHIIAMKQVAIRAMRLSQTGMIGLPSSLGRHVLHICDLIARKEVLRVYASWIVAFVENKEFAGIAVGYFENEAMSKAPIPIQDKNAVALALGRAPIPASTIKIGGNLLPKSDWKALVSKLERG